MENTFSTNSTHLISRLSETTFQRHSTMRQANEKFSLRLLLSELFLDKFIERSYRQLRRRILSVVNDDIGQVGEH